MGNPVAFHLAEDVFVDEVLARNIDGVAGRFAGGDKFGQLRSLLAAIGFVDFRMVGGEVFRRF